MVYTPYRPAFARFPAAYARYSIAIGKIASIGDAEFSVQVTKDQDVNTVQFLVDDKTKVEGKLAVGAQATVEYRSNADKNIAVHVIVTPTSGMSSY
jgi:hypothetical protein